MEARDDAESPVGEDDLQLSCELTFESGAHHSLRLPASKYQGKPRFKNCVVREENSPLFQWVMSQTPEQFDDAKCKKSD